MTIASANVVNAEFLTFNNYAQVDIDDDSDSAITSINSRVGLSKYTSFKMLLNENTKLYKIWDYISSVHVASISAFAYSFLIVMIEWRSKTLLTTRIMSALLDIYFFIRIYVNIHLKYKDPDSGIVVKDLKLIRRRYFCSLSRFWLDIITVFPFEHVALIFTNEINIIKYGYSIRILRCWFLYKYYREQENNLNVKHHLRLTYLLYRVVLSLEWSACIWFVFLSISCIAVVVLLLQVDMLLC